jgi:hypothetical protein
MGEWVGEGVWVCVYVWVCVRVCTYPADWVGSAVVEVGGVGEDAEGEGFVGEGFAEDDGGGACGCVCVYMCLWVGGCEMRDLLKMITVAPVCIFVCVCICVCVCKMIFGGIDRHVCVCMCVCVCEMTFGRI